MIKISVCIIVKNAQFTIKECLESLSKFDEIILLDNGSSDDTLKIAQEFGNVKIHKSEFIGFGALKNLAISYAKNDWILSIDSDEVLEKEVFNMIEKLDFNPKNIYALKRKNLYNGEWIKACGWYPDFVYRIFNRVHTRFNENFIHESIMIHKDSNLIKLPCSIKHYAYDNIAHLLEKMQIYSSLWAEQNAHKKSSVAKAIIHASYCFIKNYFFQKGFLYGYKGYVISKCNALGVFFKYMKLYENQITPPHSVSLIITTYNQKERLALVLDSIKHLHTLPTEVLVADDGSKEDTRELIKAYMSDFPCPLKHIWQEDRGFRLSQIRNRAINAAQGEYIIIIDGDMIVHPSFVRDHIAFAKPKVCLQGSRVILDSNTSQTILKNKQHNQDDAYAYAFGHGGFKAKFCKILAKCVYQNSKVDSKFFAKKDFIKGIRGCNMSFYKRDCEAINGFNQDFIGWGREDSEFVARFLFNGGVLRRLKFAGIAYHIYHEENARDMLESNHQIYLATIRTKAKHCQNGLKICNK